MQNARGQGISHATGDSKVPEGIQNKASKDLEDSLPNKVHDTGSGTGRQTHALNEGEDSVFPKGVQKAVPEPIERKLPNKLHNTGD
ncbi:hypothetical protein BJX62DRAFT_234994 [Aspergillus germanicus]